MDIEVLIMPETVCFSGIAMEEIPSLDGQHMEYFSNIYFTNIWYHTTDMGAGKWKNIWPDNSWGNDHAWLGEEMPRELANGQMTLDMSEGAWSDGTLVWNITWGWAETNRSTGDPPVKAITTPYNQAFALDAYGTLTVMKFQHAVSRGTNNVIRLDGNVVQGTIVTQEELDEIKGNN